MFDEKNIAQCRSAQCTYYLPTYTNKNQEKFTTLNY